MVTTLVEERLIDLLHEYSEAETRSEITRQVLYERRDFDAYSSYKRVLTSDLGGITRTALRTFLNNNGLFPPEADLDLLFWNLDRDGDGLVNWTEFLNTVMSREHSFVPPQYGTYYPFSVELEHSLMRVFEQEMVNQRNLEDSRRALHLSSYTESKLFDSVDRELKGWVSLADVDAFLKSRYAGTTYAKSERAFRRIDEDGDGRVVFEEFLRAVRPVYLYPTYADFYAFKRTNSPERRHTSPMRRAYNTTKKLYDTADKFQTPDRRSLRKSLRRSVHASVHASRSPARRHSPYRSPVKRYAQELREEILSKSLGRARYRWHHTSPLRELERERALSAAKLRSESRIRFLDDSYYSPIRGWVHTSPLKEALAGSRMRETLHREQLRESLTRETLRKSLYTERESAKKESALKSTAAKTDMSRSYAKTANMSRSFHRESSRTRELSPAIQSKMIVNFNDSIYDNKLLEEKRVNLALRYDFCLTEMFSMVDYGQSGYVSLADWQKFAYENSMALDSEDLCVIIDRYDRDRDGLLSFSEFCDLFLPNATEYRKTMQERVERNVYTFFEYTTMTQGHVRDLLRSCVTVEENFECNKFRLSDGRVLTSDEIFAFLDKYKTGYVTLTEFETALNEAGVYCTRKDARTLFDQFDKNGDGRITFDEFHSPARGRVHSPVRGRGYY